MLIMNTPHDIECVSLCFIHLHVGTGGQTRSHFSPDVLSIKKNSLVPVYGTKKVQFNYVKTMDNLPRELIFHKL